MGNPNITWQRVAVIEKLYNTIGGAPVYGSNQQKLFMTENGTNNYVTILKNQTLLCK